MNKEEFRATLANKPELIHLWSNNPNADKQNHVIRAFLIAAGFIDQIEKIEFAAGFTTVTWTRIPAVRDSNEVVCIIQKYAELPAGVDHEYFDGSEIVTFRVDVELSDD